MYLPQYYEFEQNNKWWGKGFTEWTNVKGAKPLYEGHKQPRIPLNENYYCLLDYDALKWQSELAKRYGIYGFCIYHYWFTGTQMMEKPLNVLLENKDIDVHYCFSWANHTWTKAPGKKDEKILIVQEYGDKEDWNRHFVYLNKFFKDNRYIKVDNKPVLVIYNLKNIECWDEMHQYWDNLAKASGWNGIYYISTLKEETDVEYAEKKKPNAVFEYQPTFGVRRLGYKLNYGWWYHFRYNVLNLRIYNHITKFSYDRVWNSIIKMRNKGNIKTYLGAFNDWDTSIRWGHKGNVTYNSTPEKFQKYLTRQINDSNTLNNEFLFITAWNEWSEGAYLEPDTYNQYKYLEAVKRSVKDAEDAK